MATDGAGRAVVITGASTGIGEACALRLDKEGWRVFVGVRKEADAQRLKQAASERLTPLMLDVTEQPQIDAAARMVADAVGEAGLRGLVNNAGIGVAGPLEYLSLEDLRWQFEVNTFGHIAVTQAFLPLIRKGQGRIVNIVAAYAWTGGPGTVHSAAAKAGVVALTRTLAVEWAQYGLRVNAVCPGVFHSDGARERLWPEAEQEEALLRSVPLGRFGKVGEIADAITYLASPYADYVNGEVLVVDGGAHLGKGLGG